MLLFDRYKVTLRQIDLPATGHALYVTASEVPHHLSPRAAVELGQALVRWAYAQTSDTALAAASLDLSRYLDGR